MGDNVSNLSRDNFDKLTSRGNWVIDFWAEWCGPCKSMAPHFEKASENFTDKVNFAKVNVEENYDLADRFNIMSIPALVFLKDGEVVNQIIRALPKDAIITNVEDSFEL